MFAGRVSQKAQAGPRSVELLEIAFTAIFGIMHFSCIKQHNSTKCRSSAQAALRQTCTCRTSKSVKQHPKGNRGVRVLTAMTKALASRITGAMLWLIQPVLVLFLRTLVRSRNFWKKGLSNAWHSRDGVSDELLDAYRLPQLVRGWEIGLVRFVRARVAGTIQRHPTSPIPILFESHV